MKFAISRTSDGYINEFKDYPQPVPEATPVKLRVEDDYGKSDVVTRWEVEFQTLEDLGAFIRKYNVESTADNAYKNGWQHIIIDATDQNGDQWVWDFSIEIQDDYRE